MPRLIDAEPLRAKLTWLNEYDYLHVLNDIKSLPTVEVVPLEDYKSMEQTVYKLTKAIADAVPVVRCKDCRKWCICHKSDDFYCADGERREDA